MPTGSRIVSWASDVDAELMPSTCSAPTRTGEPSRPGVRSLSTHSSSSSAAYGRQSRRAATSPTLRSSSPWAASRSTRPGSAASAAALVTGVCRRKSRTSVSTGLPPPVARRPGTVSLRASASWACGPSTAATPS